jgi:hypothetical protein
VLVIDHRLAQSEYATSVEAVQKVVYAFGSIHNIQLARLVQSRRFILVEGDDIPLLKAIHDILYPNNESLDTIPNTDVGGWGGWNYAIGFSKGFKNSLKQDITIYCIFDKDYHTSQEIENRYNQAIQESIQLHIWRKKEIENYLLVPSAICRYIQHRANADAPPITSEAVFTEIKSISERLRNNICDKIASEYFKNFRSTGVDLVTAMEHARSVVDLACQEPEGIVQIAPGKQVISTLSAWAHARFGVSLTPMRLASALRHDEVHPEIEQLLTTIHRGGAFLSRSHDTQ